MLQTEYGRIKRRILNSRHARRIVGSLVQLNRPVELAVRVPSYHSELRFPVTNFKLGFEVANLQPNVHPLHVQILSSLGPASLFTERSARQTPLPLFALKHIE